MSKSQSQFRVTRGSRTLREDGGDLIKANKSRVELMMKSNAILREELQVEQRAAKDNSRRAEEVIAQLQKEGVKYAQKISEEVKKKELIESQIMQCKEQLARNKELLKNPDIDRNSAVWRQIKEKEGELEKNLQNFNEVHSKNKNLRMQINHLRKERSLYDKIYYNLEKDIMKKKEKLIQLIRIVDQREAEKLK
jgi:DNA repair exonuclease SbcCD ATPase subunit